MYSLSLVSQIQASNIIMSYNRRSLLVIAVFLFVGDYFSSDVHGWMHQQPRRGRDPVQLFGTSSNFHENLSRREIFSHMAGTAIPLLVGPSMSLADESGENVGSAPTKGQQVSTERLASLLRAVPTFAIVDKRGVPYMVVGEVCSKSRYISHEAFEFLLTCVVSLSFPRTPRLLDTFLRNMAKQKEYSL